MTVDHEPSNINVDIQMGFDVAGLNGTATTIDDIEDAPSGVTFQNPVTVVFGSWTNPTVWNVASSMAPSESSHVDKTIWS